MTLTIEYRITIPAPFLAAIEDMRWHLDFLTGYAKVASVSWAMKRRNTGLSYEDALLQVERLVTVTGEPAANSAANDARNGRHQSPRTVLGDRLLGSESCPGSLQRHPPDAS